MSVDASKGACSTPKSSHPAARPARHRRLSLDFGPRFVQYDSDSHKFGYTSVWVPQAPPPPVAELSD
eukprot:1130094-Prymnesium_polylepis.1